MNIILCGIQKPLCDAFEAYCGAYDFVSIHHGSILDVKADAIVSPANSFGFMDGGIDAIYMDYFKHDIQMAVRRQIFDYHAGELIVGQADIVETYDESLPFLIAAPTMRVPMVLHECVNAYLAARAIFLLINHGTFKSGMYAGQDVSSQVKTVALPGLGTGVGKIGFQTCAKQVKQAIEDVVLGNYRMPQSWAEASERHQLLYTDTPQRIQY